MPSATSQTDKHAMALLKFQNSANLNNMINSKFKEYKIHGFSRLRIEIFQKNIQFLINLFQGRDLIIVTIFILDFARQLPEPDDPEGIRLQ